MSKGLRVTAIVVGAVVAFVALVVFIVFRATAGLVETADHFFAAARIDNVPGARLYLSDGFNRNVTEPELHAIIARSGLGRMRDTSWNSRSIENGHGELEGELTTTDGAHFPLKFLFVKERGEWKISEIHKTVGDADAGSAPVDASPPTNAQQVALVRAAMHEFAVSVNSRSMAHFRDTTSNLWQSQTSVADLDKAFRPLIDSGFDFLAFDRLSPQFDVQSAVDENGVLVIQGHYATAPKQLFFVQKYVREGVEWKLIGFHVHSN